MAKMHSCCFRLLFRTCPGVMAFSRYIENCQRKLSCNQHILNSHNHFGILERRFSVSTNKHYEIMTRLKALDQVDLKADAVAMFTSAIRSVSPKAMIQNTLKYNEETSQMTVKGELYHLNKNVYVVGFGKDVMGMARCIEDMLGPHLVSGIISIPKGLQKEITELHFNGMLLSQNTKVQVYEGAHSKEADETCHSAAKAVHSLAKNLTDKDLLIVLCSGGGSVLCPSPQPPITLEELCSVTRLLKNNGVSITELNVIRKNIELLKGGGLAQEAKPAKVLSLTLSSIVGDSANLIASGPTYRTQPTPQHCIEILKRLNIIDQTPENIRKFLEKGCKIMDTPEAKIVHDPMNEKAKDDAAWEHVQNVTLGDNSTACEAAASKATELGYVPLILPTALTGEARNVGYTFAKLAKYIMMCFDRKASFQPHTDLAILETTLVAEGMKKTWMNYISKKVDMARNSDRDICIIVGGNTDVTAHGTGTGGKNMETVLAAAVQMQEEFIVKQMQVAECPMCFLSGDTAGRDGVTKMAGAVVDQDFLQKVALSGLDMNKYLRNNDSFTFFSQVNGGQNLVPTKPTGTNVMDIVILLVQRPKE